MQKVQILKESRVNKGIYLYLSFFPSPRHVILSAQGFSLVEGKEKPADFKPGKSISLPISQFLKAHFNGQRLSQDLQLDENEKAQARLTFEFSSERRLIMTRLSPQKILVEMLVGDQKDKNSRKFKSIFELARIPEGKSSSGEASVPQKRERKAFERLISKLENEKNHSATLEGEFKILEKEWESEAWQVDRWNTLPLKQKLINFFADQFSKDIALYSFGEIKDLFYRQKKRIHRKALLSKERFEKISGEGFEAWMKERELKKNRSGKGLSSTSKSKKKSQSSAFHTIVLRDQFTLLVGRNASENDDLLRFAQSNDWWFHVHGKSGAHIWLNSRFNKIGKEGPDLALKELCAQVALHFSKIPNEVYEEVRFTQKRYLKKVKGRPGAVLVNRAESIRVKKVAIQELFEKK